MGLGTTAFYSLQVSKCPLREIQDLNFNSYFFV